MRKHTLVRGTARLAYLSQPKGENIGKLTRPWTSAHSPHSGSQHSLITLAKENLRRAGQPSHQELGMHMNITGREGLKYMDAVTAPYSR